MIIRERILQALKSRPMTSSQLSRRLNITLSWLGIIKKELLAEGLIEIISENKKSKLIKLK